MKKIFITLLCFVAIGCANSAVVNKGIILTARNPSYSVRLTSNPTTGYSWKSIYNKKFLTAKKTFILPKKHLIGAGGVEVWTFTATNFALKQKKTITTKVKLIYVRSWEKNKIPAKTKVISIVIR